MQAVSYRLRGGESVFLEAHLPACARVEREFDLEVEFPDREAEVLALYEGKEDTRIMIETDDGTLREVSVREMFEEFEREELEMVVIRACAGA